VICLDTNAVIAVLNGRPAMVRDRLAEALAEGRTVAVSTVVLFELHFGAAKSARPQENADRIAVFLSGPVQALPFERLDAEAAGALRARLESVGTPIGPFDCLIAGQALRHGAKLVTANAGEFARVPGLTLENWAA